VSSVLGVTFFVWLLLCILCWFEMPFVLIVLTSTLHAVFQSMSRVFILMLPSYPRLAKLFCLCKCPPLLRYTLVLSFLLLGAGFGFSLASFWGCLRFILHVFVCFIGSFKPSRMRLNMFFAYPLTELLNI
jgi:hypothetical protein